MTPAEHIAEAEAIVSRSQAHYDDGLMVELQGDLLLALVHVGIAIAVELGAPHATAPAGQVSDGS